MKRLLTVIQIEQSTNFSKWQVKLGAPTATSTSYDIIWLKSLSPWVKAFD